MVEPVGSLSGTAEKQGEVKVGITFTVGEANSASTPARPAKADRVAKPVGEGFFIVLAALCGAGVGVKAGFGGGEFIGALGGAAGDAFIISDVDIDPAGLDARLIEAFVARCLFS